MADIIDAQTELFKDADHLTEEQLLEKEGRIQRDCLYGPFACRY